MKITLRALLPLALTLGLASLSVGCGAATAVKSPSGFVQLEEDQLPSDVAQKLISSEGAVIVLREREHEPRGTLKFWSEALQREIGEGRGYEHIETVDVASEVGYKGKLLKFKGAYNNSVFRYDVALYLVDDLIVTVETVAPEELYENHATDFDAAVRSLRPN